MCQSKNKFKFDEAATIECNQTGRGSYNLSIKATPCNGVRECHVKNDENCGESREDLITSLVIVFLVILAVCGFVHHITTKQYPTMISDDPEFIDDETAKYRSGLKGNILAQIKVIKVFLI